MHDPQRLLRNSLRANGAFSTLSGLVFAFAGGAVARAIGLEAAWLVHATGIGLLGFAAYLFYTASRPELDTGVALQIVFADLAWVVGTLPVVFFDVLNRTGTLGAIAIADVVLLFAVLQYAGVRRIRGSASAAEGAA